MDENCFSNLLRLAMINKIFFDDLNWGDKGHVCLGARRSWVGILAGGLYAYSLYVFPVHALVLSGHSDFLPHSKNTIVR